MAPPQRRFRERRMSWLWAGAAGLPDPSWFDRRVQRLLGERVKKAGLHHEWDEILNTYENPSTDA